MSRYGNIAFCGNYYHSAGFPLTEYRAESVYVLKVNHPERFNLYGSDWDRLGIKSEGVGEQVEAMHIVDFLGKRMVK
jgi:hypothetical protein